MVEELAALPWDAIGLSGMAVLGVYLVFTGKLVPRSTLQDALTDRDAWRTQAQEAIRELSIFSGAVERMAASKELSVAMLQSVRAEEEKQAKERST